MPKIKVGQWWLGLSMGKERNPFLREVLRVDGPHILYRTNIMDDWMDFSKDKEAWKTQIPTYQLRLISKEQAKCLCLLWGYK